MSVHSPFFLCNIYLFVNLCLSIGPSIDLAIYLSIYETLAIYLSIHLRDTSYLSIYLRNTELSKYISFWYLNLPKCKVPRGILKHATSYNPTSNRCNLCLWEKYFRINLQARFSLFEQTERINLIM